MKFVELMFSRKGTWISFLTLVSSVVFARGIPEIDKIIESEIMNREVKYSILLPEQYYDTDKRYPVVYMLHGYGGGNNGWLKRCRFSELTDSLREKQLINTCIYVMPDAENSYYINNYDSSNMYSDFMVYELIPLIDSMYRTNPKKKSRGILGLSMGGYGAVIQAFRNPDLFGSVVALSAAVRTPEIIMNMGQNSYDKYFGNVYGYGLKGGERITAHWKNNSPYFLLDSNSFSLFQDIEWYVDCGMQDYLWPASKAFHELLLKYNIPHEFHMRPGKHNWDYWCQSTINGLIFLSGKFQN